MDPALAADVGAGQQLFQIGGEITLQRKLGQHLFRRLQRDRRLPNPDRAMIERRIVGERVIGNVGHQHAMMTNAQPRLWLHRADNDAVQPPLLEDAQHFLFTPLMATSSIRSWLSLSMIS